MQLFCHFLSSAHTDWRTPWRPMGLLTHLIRTLHREKDTWTTEGRCGQQWGPWLTDSLWRCATGCQEFCVCCTCTRGSLEPNLPCVAKFFWFLPNLTPRQCLNSQNHKKNRTYCSQLWSFLHLNQLIQNILGALHWHASFQREIVEDQLRLKELGGTRPQI